MKKEEAKSEVRLTADLQAETDLDDREEIERRPFAIAVMGDFRAPGGDAPAWLSGPLKGRRFLRIDRDNFDEVLTRFDVRWEGTIEGQAGRSVGDVRVQLRLLEMEDFSPDRIVHQIPQLQLMMETRRALGDPSRFDAVASEVMKWAKPTTAPRPAIEPVSAAAPAPNVAPSELLRMILGSEDTRTARTQDPWSANLRRFLEEAVGPHLITIDTAQQTALIGAVDQALSCQVRSVLQDPVFKRLEAAWRSLYWLVSVAETGSDLRLLVLQATKDDLMQDMSDHESLEECGLARLVLDPASVPGGIRPALLVGAYEFGPDLEDMALLERIGGIGQRLKTPFLAAAGSRLLGINSFAELPALKDIENTVEALTQGAWHTLRRSPPARWLALSLPRALCRLPYGSEAETTESFRFEELVSTSDHEALLWGNPAFRVAGVVAGAYAADGWSLHFAGGVARLEGLPLYVYRDEGETVAKPCAEVLLPQRIVEELEEAGLVPLVSYRDADRIALPCVQSLGLPRSPLSWGYQ